MKFLPGLTVLFLVLSHFSSAVAAGRLPIEAFASLPQLQKVRLSPDGKKLLVLMNDHGNSVLIARELGSPNMYRVAGTDNKDLVINWFRWANNERVVVSLRQLGWRMRTGTVETRLVSFRFDGTGGINLLAAADDWVPQIQDDVIDWLPDEPDYILVAADLEAPGFPSVYRVNVANGRRVRVSAYQEDVTQWLTDRQHRVRVGVKFKDTHYDILVRDADGGWSAPWHFSAFSEQAVWPLGFGDNPDILYVKAYHDGREAIFTVDLRDTKHALTLKYADPKYDVSDQLLYSQKAGDYVGIAAQSGESSYVFWNPVYQGLAGGIDQALPDTTNAIVSFSADESRYVLFSTSATRPGTYYLGDRVTTQLVKIGDTYPQLPPPQLAAKHGVRYKARDGVDIQAYLTLPPGGSGRNLPAIIFPHGGPIAQEDAGFDYWAQFFANRGYAVLQMDFRGSAGHGHAFMAAGLGQWGLSMQDDVTDGTRWLIDQGIADQHRICIAGASYGGYAALMGAVKTPALYRCSISFAGVSDLHEFLDSLKWYSDRKVAEQQIGKASDHALDATSPHLQAQHIEIPVLLVHGTEDRTVPFAQSELMAEALTKAGKTFRFVKQEGGGHYLSSYAQRMQLFTAMDEFLEKYLPAEDQQAGK